MDDDNELIKKCRHDKTPLPPPGPRDARETTTDLLLWAWAVEFQARRREDAMAAFGDAWATYHDR